MTNIPNTIGGVFGELKTEITWLHLRWRMYRQLFAESDERIDLLNESAGAFFYVVQDVLIGEVQVMLSKLTDPARTGEFDNLTLEQLQSLVAQHGDAPLAKKLRGLLDTIHTKCQPFRVHRNKRLAHLDLSVAMQSVSNPLPGVSRQMIEEALEGIRDYMNAIEGHYDDSETAYDMVIAHSDANQVVELLKRGLRYEELVQADTIDGTDFDQSKWKGA